MTQVYPYITSIVNPDFAESGIEYSPGVLQSSADILVVIFGSMLVFAGVTVIYNTVSALGKTMLALWIEIFSVIFYLRATYLVIEVWHWPVEKIWYVEYIYFVLIGILSSAYLIYFFKQQTIKPTTHHD
jgi:Na+-driven multidrug efflux pump